MRPDALHQSIPDKRQQEQSRMHHEDQDQTAEANRRTHSPVVSTNGPRHQVKKPVSKVMPTNRVSNENRGMSILPIMEIPPPHATRNADSFTAQPKAPAARSGAQ